MAVITENISVAENIRLMRVSGLKKGGCGQFYMIKPAETTDPLLGRPISLHDYDEISGVASFLYAVVGKGTRALSRLQSGMELTAHGPYGNGFKVFDSDAVLIGGGIGIAPLFMLAKDIGRRYPQKRVIAYLGFSSEPFMVDAFKDVCDDVFVNVGGYVTDDVDFSFDAVYYACGSTPMMKTAASKMNGARLYVSLENKMACGAGACLGCTCQTMAGNKRVCKDGPVFLSEEVFFDGR